MTSYADRLARGRREHGERFDPSSLDAHPEFIRWYESGERVRVRTVWPRGGVWERTGRISTTTGWRPAWMLVYRSNAHGSSDLLDGLYSDVVVAVQRGRKYVPVQGGGGR